MRGLMPGSGGSRRQVQQFRYLSHAYGVLWPKREAETEPGDPEPGDPYAWLRLPGDGLRVTLLSELGRLGDPDLIRTIAARVCAVKPAAREGALRIRRLRAAASAPKPGQLGQELAHAIDDYLLRYPATPVDAITTELESLIETVAVALSSQSGQAAAPPGAP
jgi:hypothetical protein